MFSILVSNVVCVHLHETHSNQGNSMFVYANQTVYVYGFTETNKNRLQSPVHSCSPVSWLVQYKFITQEKRTQRGFARPNCDESRCRKTVACTWCPSTHIYLRSPLSWGIRVYFGLSTVPSGGKMLDSLLKGHFLLLSQEVRATTWPVVVNGGMRPNEMDSRWCLAPTWSH